MGVPSKRSAPDTIRIFPSFSVASMPKSLTEDSPMLFGLKGERVAKTPIRLLPPRRGGRTVGENESLWAKEKSRCENSSIPLI